jgi:hypothetical protein
VTYRVVTDGKKYRLQYRMFWWWKWSSAGPFDTLEAAVAVRDGLSAPRKSEWRELDASRWRSTSRTSSGAPE